MLPAITVGHAVLNAAATLPGDLASVRAQAYPGLEHVVVDGGSTDGTVESLQATEGIRWISEPDRGLATRSTRASRMATGDVIGELNADDVYEPGALHAVGAALRDAARREWLTGCCRIIDGDGAEIRKPVTAYKNWLLRHYSLGLYLTHNFISAPATFFRRAALAARRRLRRALPRSPSTTTCSCGSPAATSRSILDRDLVELPDGRGLAVDVGLQTQFREHAEQARRHGDGHRGRGGGQQA